jgi:hypothetical protein
VRRQLSDRWPALVASALGFGIVFVAGAGDLRLRSHDAFFYARMAAWLAVGDWRALGLTWPPGFPLVAAPLVRLGMHPAAALVAVNLTALVAILTLMDRLISTYGVTRRARLGWLCGLACLTCWADVLLDPMSEPLFVVATLGLVASFSRLPQLRAMVTSSWLVLAAFLIRYVGASYAIVLPVATFFRRRDVPRGHIVALAGCLLGLGLWVGMLFAVNAWQSGEILGDPARLHERNSLAGSLAALGRSVIRLGGVDWSDHLGPGAQAGRIAVAVLVIVAVVGGAWGASRSQAMVRRAAGWTALTYLFGLLAANASVAITGASASRMTLPLLFPAVLMAIPVLPGSWLKLARLGVPLLVAFQVAVAIDHGRKVRSWEAPVRQAETWLAPRIGSNAIVALNLGATSVARRLRADFRMAHDSAALARQPDVQLVVLTNGWDGQLEPAWAQARTSGELAGFRLWTRTPDFLVFATPDWLAAHGRHNP